MNERIKTDVLVIGAGGAGMMAAIAAREAGARVCLVCKTKVMRGGATVMAPGAIAAVDSSWKTAQDSIQRHIEDTLACAQGLADPFIVRQTAEMAGSMIRFLESRGALFQRTEDGSTLALRTTGGHSCYRSPFIENRVGREICRILWGELNRLGVQVLEETMLTEPVLRDGRVCGGAGIRLKNCQPVEIMAKSTILATGGAGYIYSLTDNANDLTGDGFAFALKAGARLTDMEFVQFYPMGFVYPSYARGQVAGFPAYVRLYNAENARFMEHYDPRLEYATRDALGIAIAKEVQRGYGSPHGGVYCSMEHLEPGRIERELPGLYATYRAAGIDPYRDRFEVGPAAHFFQGGVQVDEYRRSCAKGLYAVGEVAAGMHGANRLGQNALIEILVSGYIAGMHAAAADPVDEALPLQVMCPWQLAGAVHRNQIRQIMQEHVGVLRTGKNLESAEQMLEGLLTHVKPFAGAADGWEAREAMENLSMLVTAACVTRGAKLRTESRGCHYREDYPQKDPAWSVHLVQSLCDGRLHTAMEHIYENDN